MTTATTARIIATYASLSSAPEAFWSEPVTYTQADVLGLIRVLDGSDLWEVSRLGRDVNGEFLIELRAYFTDRRARHVLHQFRFSLDLDWFLVIQTSVKLVEAVSELRYVPSAH